VTAPEAPAPAASPPRPAALDAPTGELLAQATRAYHALDFENGLTLAEAALARPDIRDDQRVEAYALVASLYAIMDQSVEAERPYRLLLRLQPAFDLPPETPPKILAVFRKVQAEEREIRDAVKAAQRRAVVQALRLDVSAPTGATGGQPLTVTVAVTDPLRGVAQLTLEYRLKGDAPFASLPMERMRDLWEGTLTSGQTATLEPVTLQYRVLARDAEGTTLREAGTLDAPLSVAVAPGGLVAEAFYRQRRFWVAALGALGGLTAVGLVTGAAVLGMALVGAVGTYLLLRGDGVPQTSAGRQTL
jgi:hypothetical protein